MSTPPSPSHDNAFLYVPSLVETLLFYGQPIQYGKCVGDHVQEWYASFVGGLDNEMLFELLLAGNYLDLTPLLELCAATVGLRTMSESVSFYSRFVLALNEQTASGFVHVLSSYPSY